MSHEKIKAYWETLDHQWVRFQRMMEEAGPDSSRSMNQEWSAIENAEHLYLTESWALQYLKYKMSENAEPACQGLLQRLKLFWLLRFMKSRKTAKAPSLVDPRQEGSRAHLQDSDLLIRDFKKLREDFRGFLDQRESAYLKKAIFKHPAIGRINAEGMMKFFIEHFERHIRQAEEQLSALTG